MLIRRATPDDIPGVVRVHLGAWDAAKQGLDIATRRTAQEREELWTRFFDEGRGELRISEADGTIIGFIAFGPSRDDDRTGECEVYTLYVDPAAWSGGVGSALIAELPAQDPVSLWVGEGNARARAFYDRHGFRPDGAREEGHHVPVIRVVRDTRETSPAPGGPLVE